MMNEMDLDNTGSIEFDEFAVVMAKKLPKLKKK
jgi:Ca2+-binding EF-hand superfamily protein